MKVSIFRGPTLQLLRYLPLVLWVSEVNAQSCLVLSPPIFSTDGTASMELSLISAQGKGPAAVQWTFQLQSSSTQNLTVDDGATLISSGKTAMCHRNADVFNCLAVGANSNTIGNGVIAKLTVLLVPGTTAAPIAIGSSLGASVEGYFVPVRTNVLFSPGSNASSDCVPRPRGRGVPSK